MPTLPWEAIQREILAAVVAYAKEGFTKPPFAVNCKHLAEHITCNPDDYPYITHNASFKGINGRVSMGINKMGWTPWTRGNTCGGGMKYIIPWDELK